MDDLAPGWIPLTGRRLTGKTLTRSDCECGVVAFAAQNEKPAWVYSLDVCTLLVFFTAFFRQRSQVEGRVGVVRHMICLGLSCPFLCCNVLHIDWKLWCSGTFNLISLAARVFLLRLQHVRLQIRGGVRCGGGGAPLVRSIFQLIPWTIGYIVFGVPP